MTKELDQLRQLKQAVDAHNASIDAFNAANARYRRRFFVVLIGLIVIGLSALAGLWLWRDVP